MEYGVAGSDDVGHYAQETHPCADSSADDPTRVLMLSAHSSLGSREVELVPSNLFVQPLSCVAPASSSASPRSAVQSTLQYSVVSIPSGSVFNFGCLTLRQRLPWQMTVSFIALPRKSADAPSSPRHALV